MRKIQLMALLIAFLVLVSCEKEYKKPNVIYVFADQWRAQATGYAGDVNAITPNLDQLAREGINIKNAVSTCPSCTPYRASLLTGMYSTTHGLLLNDILLDPDSESMAKIYKRAGYNTAYWGKWHLGGPFRLAYISESNRQGFDYWKVMECTHDYMDSWYYDGNDRNRKRWNGYDAHEQAKDICQYISDHAGDDKPFLAVLSWGPPHDPYEQVPEKYLDMYSDLTKIVLRDNVPEEYKDEALKMLKGYYAHIAALDESIGWIMQQIKESGIEDNTILIFTSDHGDMVGSQGMKYKSNPWDESIMVPFLLRYPAAIREGRTIEMPVGTPDILPTLLGLCGIETELEFEGRNFSAIVLGKEDEFENAALITNPTKNVVKREFRGVRTSRYTYVEDLNGPWLLYDNEKDPYQFTNLIQVNGNNDLQAELKAKLTEALIKANDEFLPEQDYLERFGIYLTEGGYPPFNMEYEPNK
jgi:arylsulfatase A-like enzyme